MSPTPPGPVEPVRPPAPAAPSQPARRRAERRIRYTERSRIRVRGSATGRVYEFSGEHPVQSVDGQDAVALLATHFFRPAGY